MSEARLPAKRGGRTLAPLLAGLVSLVAVSFLVVGIPLVLVKVVGSPLPSGLTSGPGGLIGIFNGSRVEHLLSAPIPSSFWPKAFASIGWLLWVWTCVGLLVEVARRAGMRRLGALPGTRTSHRLVGGLVSKVMVAGVVVYAILAHSSPAGAAEALDSPVAPSLVLAAPSANFGTSSLPSLASFGAGLSASALLLSIEKLRRVQQRRRPVGAIRAVPPPELLVTEHHLREGHGSSVNPDLVRRLAESAHDLSGSSIRELDVTAIRENDPNYEIEVALLGPVEVRGAVRQFRRARSLELVVYLAVHRSGVEREVWAEAMWPDKMVPRSTIDSTVSVARTALGKAGDGSLHLPTGRGKLVLGDAVTSDWERFTSLTVEGPLDRNCCMEALGLVRGRLFEGLRNAGWALYEGIAPTMEARIVDLACEFARRCIDDGDYSIASWSARQGLKVSPYDERLYRILMLAADGMGNRTGVVAAMEELRGLVAEDVEPYDGVHPETERLYRSLLGIDGDYSPTPSGPAGTSTAIFSRASSGTISNARSWVAARTT